jgi:hypothetical protein
MFWKSKTTKRLEAQLEQLTSVLTEVTSTKNTLEARLNTLEEAERERKARWSSDTPWVELIGDQLDNNNRLQIELDWNPAFIRNLRENGFTGDTEDIIVQRWLGILTSQIVDRLEQHNIEERTNADSEFL